MKCKTATLLLCIIVFGPANVVTASAIDVVRANVFAWARAWESRDIDRYMAFYSPDFRAKDLNFSAWKAKKAYIFQKKDAIQVKIIDLWVLMESNRAVATFVQQYKDRTVAEVAEKTLVLVNSNHSWKIVSEAWKPMATPARTARDAKQVRTAVEYNKTVQGRRQDRSKREQKDSQAERTLVNSVHFQIKERWEQVCIGLNRYAIPKVLTLEGDRPRIVLDIMDVLHWDGEDKIPVNGRLIRQIRTYLHRDTDKLRIVLDLNPAKDYIINQTFNNPDRIYCIEIR